MLLISSIWNNRDDSPDEGESSAAAGDWSYKVDIALVKAERVQALLWDAVKAKVKSDVSRAEVITELAIIWDDICEQLAAWEIACGEYGNLKLLTARVNPTP